MTTVMGARKRQSIIDRDGYRCYHCHGDFDETNIKVFYSENKNGEKVLNSNYGSNYPTAEHLIPVSQGGSNDITNLVLSCYACNNARGNMNLDEWLRSEFLAAKRRIVHNIRTRQPHFVTEWQMHEV